MIYSPNDTCPFDRKDNTPTPVLREYKSKENSVISPKDNPSPLTGSNRKVEAIGNPIPKKHEATQVLSKSSKINQVQKAASNFTVDMSSRASPIRKMGEHKSKRIPEKFKQISFLNNHVIENGNAHQASKATENMSVD